jgi:hypothetical protein
VQRLELGDLLAGLVGLEQVDRLLAHDAEHHALASGDLDALAHQDHGIPAADSREPEEAVVVDVMDDQPDLVDVADDGQRAAVGRAADGGHGGADGVLGDLREGRRGLAEHGRRRLLVARGPRGGEQLEECLRDGHRGRGD